MSARERVAALLRRVADRVERPGVRQPVRHAEHSGIASAIRAELYGSNPPAYAPDPDVAPSVELYRAGQVTSDDPRMQAWIDQHPEIVYRINAPADLPTEEGQK